MKDAPAIKVQNVSKKYCKSLKKSMLYGIKDIGKNMLGFSSNSHELRKNEFWAVRDVSFELKKGGTLGIVGPNGSGKTTLLKMLNGIFWPDRGKITISGRTGALIEVGAGFHPLLTGRENIYINAAILGMKKEEVEKKFDDIIQFADIGDFIDVPVKHYSSGMYVRLGFAVAAHCEPEILLVDEVLAVGDAAFRHKCSDRMKELIRDCNCSIILVSHNMQTIEAIAEKAILLNKGEILSSGNTNDVVAQYDLLMRPKDTTYSSTSPQPSPEKGGLMLVKKYSGYTDNSIEVKKIWLEASDGKRRTTFSGNEDVAVFISYKLRSPNIKIQRGFVWLSFINEWDMNCLGTRLRLGEQGIPSILPETGVLCAWFRPLQLSTSSYKIAVHFYDETFSFPYATGHYGYLKVISDIPTNIPGVNTPVCWSKSQWTLEK
jgi:ABC-type polysaccharide/polyol phosphate transport system ATPase subunit